MRVYREPAELRAEGRRRRAVTVGVFDGCHRGHARIIQATREAARRRELDAALAVTFWPHPLSLVAPDRAPDLILEREERIAALAATGLDELLLLDFDAALAATSYTDFTRELLVADLGMAQLTVGYDFHLGRAREGSAEAMATLGESLGFQVEIVTPCYLDGRIISSTRIRADLAAARMEAVDAALGRPWILSGVVERGDGRGRQLGFPTANLGLPAPEKLLPPAGVYLVSLSLSADRKFGVMNLGWAPTLKARFTPEIHVLDWTGDLYGQAIQINVLQWIREEKLFPDATALELAIADDLAEARRRIAAIPGAEGENPL